MKAAYHQVPLKSEDKPLTAFEACGKLFQFTKLPFGVTNAVPAFQRIIDGIIAEEKLNKTMAYLDNVIICGNSKEEHDVNLQSFLFAVKKRNITLNDEKCQFSLESINILGYTISNKSKKSNSERLDCLLSYPTPKSAKELERLLGLFAYNARWVSNYSNKIQPLLKTLQQNHFPLLKEAKTAIETLKADISNASLTIPIVIQTDASGSAIGATLFQSCHPIGFFSRTLSPSERNQSVIEREAMAIIEAVRKWSDYVRSFKTIIKTDQKSVAYLFSTPKSRIKMKTYRDGVSNYQVIPMSFFIILEVKINKRTQCQELQQRRSHFSN